MKTNKKTLLAVLLSGLVVMLLFFGGCKKELSLSGDVTKPDIIMSTEGIGAKTKVLRKSPGGGLQITMKSTSVKRVFADLKSKDKINSDLRESNKKKKAEAVTTSDATFTAYNNGTYYTCHAEVVPNGGPHDWYLINWYTGVYTYIGTSADYYIDFNVQKPKLYGNYRLWAEGPNGAGYTGYQYLGDAYSGVSINTGILSFTNQAAYDALTTRLKDAYDTHQTFLDQYDTMTGDAADAAAISAGFNQFLPYEEFEAHFRLSSLRAKIQGEVDYWFSQPHTDMSDFPEDAYFPYTYEKQTLITSGGQVEIGGVGEGPITFPISGWWTNPSNPGPGSCMFQAKKKDQMAYGDSRLLKQKVIVDAEEGRTIFVGQSKTYKKFLGIWSPSLQRQRTRVYGNHYNASCVFQSTFNSGYTNGSNRLRYSEEPHYKVMVAYQASKSGELHTDVIISSLSSSPYTLTYSH